MSVTRAPLTITADNQSRVFGIDNPALTFTPTGLVNGDLFASIGLTPSLGTTATKSSAVGSYPISASGAATTANYAVAYTSGTLQVSVAPTTVSASASPEPSTAAATDTLSATVNTAAAGGLDPNNEGTVTFTEGATPLCTTITLVGNAASCTYNAFAGPTLHTITATYNPSANFQTSSVSFAHQVN
jgi:hypothetical protein